MGKNFKVVHSELVKDQITIIFDWYENKIKGLGFKFFDSLEITETQMLKTPFGFECKYRNTREIGIGKFPYMYIYTVELNVIYIHALFPTKSKPPNKYKKLGRKR